MICNHELRTIMSNRGAERRQTRWDDGDASMHTSHSRFKTSVNSNSELWHMAPRVLRDLRKLKGFKDGWAPASLRHLFVGYLLALLESSSAVGVFSSVQPSLTLNAWLLHCLWFSFPLLCDWNSRASFLRNIQDLLRRSRWMAVCIRMMSTSTIS